MTDDKIDKLATKLGPGPIFGGLIADPILRRIRDLEDRVSKLEERLQEE